MKHYLTQILTPRLKYLLEGDNWIAERFMDEKRQAEHKREDGERINREHSPLRNLTNASLQAIAQSPFIADDRDWETARS